MDSNGNPLFSGSERHWLSNRLEALQNLAYLIRLEISNPARVNEYLDWIEKILREMREEHAA